MAGKEKLLSSVQLPLEMALQDHAVFDSFLPAGNELAIDRLVALSAGAASGPVFLFGASGSGKTHLLQAACAAASGRGRLALFLSLAADSSDAGIAPAILDGLETLDLICLDNIDAIAGDADWETALFDLFNRLQENDAALVVSASSAPAVCGIDLADLVSRLSSGPVFKLNELSEEARITALCLRANKRGFELPCETAGYLIRRIPRDTHSLFQFLDRLDRASLAQQRKLTIPFVKDLMD